MIKCRIEELVKNSGFKKKYVAETIEVSIRQFRNYEKQIQYIPMNKAYPLADLLGVNVSDLYEWNKEEYD